MLLEKLVAKSTKEFSANWKENLLVRSMDDGKMGSLLLFPGGIIENGRKFGARVSELKFNDADGVEVIASLNADELGRMFELDSWKTDFSPLIQIPQNL